MKNQLTNSQLVFKNVDILTERPEWMHYDDFRRLRNKQQKFIKEEFAGRPNLKIRKLMHGG